MTGRAADRRRWRWSVVALAAPVALAAGATVLGLSTDDTAGPVPEQAVPSGEDLYLTQCASCHGVDGAGVEDRGPSLAPEGEASVDFVLRTGRMPLADPSSQARRGPVRYSDAEIEALVAYAGAFGDGPGVPEVAADGDVVAGGVLYRLNCAACHVASGAGAAIGSDREAPSLMEASATEIGEAILVGPGAMPSFGSFGDEDIADVAAYIAELRASDATAVTEFGGAGPVAEGLAAWLIGLIPLIALTRWIGAPHEGRDTDATTPPPTLDESA